MLPVIQAYLNSPAGGWQGSGYLADTYPELKPRTFCTAAIVEIRPTRHSRVRVGMETVCNEYARRGHTLLVGTQSAGLEAMILGRTSGAYKVVSAVSGPDAYSPSWENRYFSKAGRAVIDGASPPTPPSPITQAWRAFGFLPGTRAVEP